MWTYVGPTTFETSYPSMVGIKVTSQLFNDDDGSSFTLQLVAHTMDDVAVMIAEWLTSSNKALANIGPRPTEDALKAQIVAAVAAINRRT